MKILIVDDEDLIRDVLRGYLELEGFLVDDAVNGEEAVNKAKSNDYDLIIMDIMMPKKDGYQACKEIKGFCDIPFIMLSARGEEYDKLIGFDLGIDDYVTKPFSPKEVVARVKAVLKRANGDDERYVFDGLIVDDKAHEVSVDGKIVELTPKEYDLLKYLITNKNIALSRDKLLAAIWGYSFYGDDRTIDTHIKTLRNNLGNYRDFIKTIRGMGYKFEYKENNRKDK